MPLSLVQETRFWAVCARPVCAPGRKANQLEPLMGTANDGTSVLPGERQISWNRLWERHWR